MRPAAEPRSAAPVFANADWVRGLERTAAVEPSSRRTLALVLDENARRHGARLALIGEGATLTHDALAALAAQVANFALGQGLRAGDRVALVMTNCPAYAAIWLGLSRVGVVTALINTQLVGASLAHCLSVADARLVIVDADCLEPVRAALDTAATIWTYGIDAAPHPRLDTALAAQPATPPHARDAPEVTLADPALLIYTSGTTGLPKAARVSHYRIMMWSEWFAGIMDARADDRLYDCLPMYHSVGGVVAVGAMLVAGGSVVVRRGFSAGRFWDDVARSGSTIVQYIGELCRFLLNTPPGGGDVTHGLRLCIGNGLRADVWEPFAARFAIPRIIEFYAATEGSFSLFNLDGRPGSIGRVPRFMAHRSPVAIVRFDVAAGRPLRDDAGLCIRCAAGESGEAIGKLGGGDGLATRFEGYTDEAASLGKVLRDVFEPGDAWFRTGDLMRRDAQGFFYFVDRIGDTFRWKGENVATGEVADALCACPGVLEASVYGVSVPGADGRAGMATLVTGDGFDLVALHAHLRGGLPRYARPVFLRLRAALAMTGTFKQRKSDDAGDGFDPALVPDPLYVDDGAAYRPLDEPTHAAILGGALRL